MTIPIVLNPQLGFRGLVATGNSAPDFASDANLHELLANLVNLRPVC